MPLTITDELPRDETRLRDRAAGHDPLDQHAVRDRDVRGARERRVDRSPSRPSQGCATWPFSSSCGITALAMSIGIAKPTPTLPLTCELLGSCALMPITAPVRSISGPPELPWLIAASVCRRVPDREAVRRRDLAMDGRDDARGERAVEPERVADRDDRVADLTDDGVAERQRCSAEAGRSTLSTARSVEASVPMTFALTLSRFENETRTPARLPRRAGS